MKALKKLIIILVILMSVSYASLELFLAVRDNDYNSVYQRVDVKNKWDAETVLQFHLGDKAPDNYLVKDDSLYLLIQTTDLIYVLDTEPWTKQKLDRLVPKEVQSRFINEKIVESWLDKELSYKGE